VISDRKGTTTSVSVTAGGNNESQLLSMGDFNGDGILDLAALTLSYEGGEAFAERLASFWAMATGPSASEKCSAWDASILRKTFYLHGLGRF
jgi:hypothetical protein